MINEKSILLIIPIAMALLFIAISIPHIKRKIAPNNYCGFRTKKTLSDKEIWYKANEYIGKEIVKASLIMIVVSITLVIISSKLPHSIILIAITTTSILPMLVAFIRSLLYLRKL